MSEYNASAPLKNDLWSQLSKAIESQIYIPFTKNRYSMFMFRTQIMFICLNILRDICKKNKCDPSELINILHDELAADQTEKYQKLLFCYFYIAYSFHDLSEESKARRGDTEKSDDSEMKDQKIEEFEKKINEKTDEIRHLEKLVELLKMQIEDMQRAARKQVKKTWDDTLR